VTTDPSGFVVFVTVVAPAEPLSVVVVVVELVVVCPWAFEVLVVCVWTETAGLDSPAPRQTVCPLMSHGTWPAGQDVVKLGVPGAPVGVDPVQYWPADCVGPHHCCTPAIAHWLVAVWKS